MASTLQRDASFENGCSRNILYKPKDRTHDAAVTLEAYPQGVPVPDIGKQTGREGRYCSYQDETEAKINIER